MILQLKEIVNNKVITTGNKELYNSDISNCSKWTRKEVKGLETLEVPSLSGYKNIKQKGRGRLANNALGYMHNNSNNVYHNDTLVVLYSVCSSAAKGFSILPVNFRKAVALFTARRTIKPTWTKWQDEYLIPQIGELNGL